MIGFIIVTVECFFANCECSLDCDGVFVTNRSCGKMFVDVIHSRYDGSDVGRPSGKEKSRILEDLMRWEDQDIKCIEKKRYTP